MQIVIALTGIAKILSLMMEFCMPASLTQTLSRGERERTNRCASFTLLFLLAGIAQAEPLGEAQRAQEAGDYARAATLFLPLAAKGDPVAQFNLGLLYTQGLIIQRNYPVALQWYLAAAEQGHAQAQANLGLMYERGNGVPQDFKKAMHWLTLSAKQGNSSAQLETGQMYATGMGVPQDYAEAIKWYRLAADQGNAAAHARLSDCYENGLGVAQDSVAASKWLAGAASYANDESSRLAYLARRDAIEKGIASRKLAEQQQQARIEAARVKAAEAALAEAARMKAEQAATEQARQKASEKAALNAQIQAKKLADIAEKSARKKAEQQARSERNSAAAQRKSELEVEMARRRAEINAETAQRKREIAAETRHAKSLKTGVTEVKHSGKPQADIAMRDAPSQLKNPVKEQQTRVDTGAVNEQNKTRVTGRIGVVSSKKYPAKTELTDEELKHPLMHEAQEPGTGIPGKPLIKLKKIEWSKKQDDS